MVQQVFDSKIAIFQYDGLDTFEGRDKVKKTIDSVFDSFDIKNSTATEAYNGGMTTVKNTKQFPIDKLLDFKNHDLGRWILKHISIGAKELGIKNKNYNEFKFVRSWMNRTLKGSHGAAHKHNTVCDMVCIFYYEAPENSSDLVFINDVLSTMNTDRYDMFPENKRFHLKPKPGMFVCHDPDIPHAISTHNNDLPRTVIVFEPFFKLAD